MRMMLRSTACSQAVSTRLQHRSDERRTRENDEEAVDAEAESGTPRDPDAVHERVEAGEAGIARLLQPAIDEDEGVPEVEAASAAGRQSRSE